MPSPLEPSVIAPVAASIDASSPPNVAAGSTTASEACRSGLQQEASGWVRPDVGYTRSVFEEAGQAGGAARVEG